MNAAREYTVAIGDKLSRAIEDRSLKLIDLQIVPGAAGKFIVRGMVSRPIAMQEKVFAVEVAGNMKRVNITNVDGFVDYMLPRIVDAFYGEDTDTVKIIS